ncbi:MAG: ABC transporter ATP-binding protein [Anaerolineae bacterium]|nr:ABC transporter ATP-binding protein [Anaerolineae bacterium]
MANIRVQDVSVSFEKSSELESRVGTVTGGLANLFRRDPSLGNYSIGVQGEPPRPAALKNANLDIRDGETMGVLGPSGCGKTTLLRVIAGLQPVNSGTVFYDDQDMLNIQPHERGIGIVFQNYALYPNMNSEGNVSFFFRLRHRDEEIPERIREVSKVMGIGFEKLLDRRPAFLSGGERQRVALARCIARDPKLLLFDEPLSNLDAKLRVQTRGELKRLIQRYKVTTLYVTHDQTEALALCDRLAIMDDGHVQQVGTPTFLMQHPNSTMVATFLGSPPMNLFEGHFTETGFDAAQFSLTMPTLGYEQRHIILGVRAEHFHLDPDGPIRGEVILVEPLLAERAQLVYMEMGTTRIVARLLEEPRLHVGDQITLNVDSEQIHRFDPRTGKRL